MRVFDVIRLLHVVRIKRVVALLRELTQRYGELSQAQGETARALERLANRVATTALTSNDGPSSVQDYQSELEHDPEKEEAEFQYKRRQTMATLTDPLSSESLDEAWSVQAMDQIARISENLQHDGSTLGYMDCRATLCKLEVNHRDREALVRSTEALPMELKWNSTMTMHVTNHADGTNTSVVFISRDGYDLDY